MQPSSPPIGPQAPHHTVSVIVTTQNDAATIGACLKSAVYEDLSLFDYEIIVVDNNSTDSTQAIAAGYTTQVLTHTGTLSEQRNYGVSQSRGEYLLFIDPSLVLSPSVLSEALSITTPEAQAVTIYEESFGESYWASCKALEKTFYKGVDWIESPRFFTRVMFNRVGGYDAAVTSGENQDLRDRIKQVTNIAYVVTPLRRDEGALTLKTLIKRQKDYAWGNKKVVVTDNAADMPKSNASQSFGLFKLYFEQLDKILKNPKYGFGMLFMKCFEIGALLFYSRVKRPKATAL